MKFIRNFEDLRIGDVPEVGGKNASLGEMIAALQPLGIRIPPGFATTADAFLTFLDHNKLRPKVFKMKGSAARAAMMKGAFPEELEKEICKAYRDLKLRDVAVRSSATAEDLPGQIACWLVYLFLFETVMIAHIAGGGSITSEIASGNFAIIPAMIFYVILFSPVVYLGTKTVDRLNLVMFSGVLITYFLFIIFSASVYPHPIIVRMSDFKTNEYANLIGGDVFEPKEDNPMLGFRGASRYYSPRYREGFSLECQAIKRVREKMGFNNVLVMIPFCRTVEEADKVLEVMEEEGLKRGEIEVYVMCEIPSNVTLAEEFAKRFDGFSIGSNDLTQLVLGVDRDAEDLAALFDERNEAVKKMIYEVIQVARKAKCKIGICGQAPSDYPDFAAFLVDAGIDSISLNPDSVIGVIKRLAK